MKQLYVASGLIAIFLSASAPALSDTVETSVRDSFNDMNSAQDEETYINATRKIIALGRCALPELTKHPPAAKDDDERIAIT
ncbi:hypothetical protein [Brucella cytisi]|nr:hypothetical protein [Brucella cytisi]